jgi:hypothetical protein
MIAGSPLPSSMWSMNASRHDLAVPTLGVAGVGLAAMGAIA